jgi:transposase InsO family protein
MHRLGLRAKSSKRFKRTSDSNHGKLVSPNLLERRFEVLASNQLLVSENNYIRSAQGWLYLATVIDLYRRAVVAWQMSRRIYSELVCDALQAATLTRTNQRATWFTPIRARNTCQPHTARYIISVLVQSMSRSGNCWDDAVAEYFFTVLKNKLFTVNPLQPDNRLNKLSLSK